jgi:hypothetical protein
MRVTPWSSQRSSDHSEAASRAGDARTVQEFNRRGSAWRGEAPIGGDYFRAHLSGPRLLSGESNLDLCATKSRLRRNPLRSVSIAPAWDRKSGQSGPGPELPFFAFSKWKASITCLNDHEPGKHCDTRPSGSRCGSAICGRRPRLAHCRVHRGSVLKIEEIFEGVGILITQCQVKWTSAATQ